MTEPRWLDEQEMAAWNAFLEASHLVERRIEQQLKDQEGLSHPQYEIMVRLADAPNGEMRMTELAGLLLTSKSGVTYQIGKLEKAGLVWRHSCPGDDRGVFAMLTEQGLAKLRRAAPRHLKTVRSVLIDVLSRDQMASLTDGLESVARELRPRG